MKTDRKRILLTGAAGFIGAALWEALLSRGYDVLGIDNLNDYYDVRLKEARIARIAEKNFEKADITDAAAMERIFSKFEPEIVINLAAQAGVRYSLENPFSYVKNNVEGFLVLLECMRRRPVEKFLYASSSSVYGNDAESPFKETALVDSPASLYAATKKSNELMARAYSRLFGIPAVGLRFFTVYGPWGRPDMAPMLFARAISKGESIRVFNHGEMSRDFTYIDDIVDGVVKVVESDLPIDKDNDILNIGHGSPVSLPEFIALLEKAMGREAKKEYVEMQPGDVTTTFADTERMARLYGYRAATPLEEGIRRFAEWYNSELNPLR
ncbi:MAG: NAD-dependent epimerase/dehydratase family protein [Muribaculaceae bacterium]|nr:NAD-dependent epimerase/dehydratase family protein [Muribaculaceae bacterium]